MHFLQLVNFAKKIFDKKYVPVLIISVTLFFSLYKLTNSPPLWIDEGYYMQVATNLTRYGVWGLEIAPHTFASLANVSAGFPFLLPLAIIYKIFGVGILQGRLMMSFFILCLVLFSFLFLRKKQKIRSATLAMALLATFPVLYGNGKTVIAEVPALVYLVLFFYLFDKWLVDKKKKNAAFAGIFFGLVITFKLSFLLSAIPSLIIVIVFSYSKLCLKLKDLFIFASCTALSLVIWILTQFDRSDTLFKFYQTTFLHYGETDTSSHFLTNLIQFFKEISPLYLLITMLVWFIAFGIRYYKKQDLQVVECFAFIFSLLNVGIFLLSPGWYRYYFPAQIVALMFFPHAWFELSDFVLKGVPGKLVRKLPELILWALVLVQVYQLGFSSFVATYYNSQRNKVMQEKISQLDRNKTYFIYSTPEIVPLLPPVLFYQYMDNHVSNSPGLEFVSKIEKGEVDRIILIKTAYDGNEALFHLYKISEIIAKHYLVLDKIQ